MASFPRTDSMTGITPRYGEALRWAEELHRQQRRKGKPIPYIAHRISVSALVWDDGGSEDQAIADRCTTPSKTPARPTHRHVSHSGSRGEGTLAAAQNPLH